MSDIGGYLYDFVPDVPLNYICVSCNLPLKKPHQISICGHRICFQCFQNMNQESELRNGDLLCPFDEESINEAEIFPDIAVEKELLNWNVKCGINNCLWVGPLKEIEKHMMFCGTDNSEENIMTKEDFDMLAMKVFNLESRMRSYEEKLTNYEKQLQKKDAEIMALKNEILIMRSTVQFDGQNNMRAIPFVNSRKNNTTIGQYNKEQFNMSRKYSQESKPSSEGSMENIVPKETLKYHEIDLKKTVHSHVQYDSQNNMRCVPYIDSQKYKTTTNISQQYSRESEPSSQGSMENIEPDNNLKLVEINVKKFKQFFTWKEALILKWVDKGMTDISPIFEHKYGLKFQIKVVNEDHDHLAISLLNLNQVSYPSGVALRMTLVRGKPSVVKNFYFGLIKPGKCKKMDINKFKETFWDSKTKVHLNFFVQSQTT